MNTTKTFEDTSFTFTVDDVKQNGTKPKYFASPKHLLSERTSKKLKLEDFSHENDTKTKLLDTDRNGLMAAIHYAYINHYPLRISVSDFILMIGQGLANHMEIHAEDVRSHFVDFQGKEKITVERFDFAIGAKNDWSTVFGEFAEKIRERVKTDLYDIMVDDTSVATKLSRIASEITIMDSFKHYFEYEVMMGCAITQITLVGSSSDWERLRSKVRKLIELNKDDRLKLSWWLERLAPVVDKIVDQAISRKIDKSFWSGIYQTQEKEGFYDPTPLISGWINVFNPYIMRLDLPVRSNFDKIDPETLISGVSSAPVNVIDLRTGKKYPMRVFGGFLGAEMLEDRTVGAVYFYAVAHDEETNKRR